MASGEVKKKLSGKTKAAIIAISLGTESAAAVFKNLKEDEIEQIIVEISRIGSVEPETSEVVLQQFYDLCLAQKYITEGGMEYAKEVLEKAFGAQDAHAIIDKITSSLKIRAFDFIRKIEPQYLLGFLQNEHPQTIALILSYARVDQAAQIIAMLPREKQLDVTERMATLDRTSPETIRDVEKSLEKKLSTVFTDQFMEAGGVSNVAEILNHVDRGTEKYISEELFKKNQPLAEEIRKRMFVFEDIISLDAFSIQRVLSDVDTKDLMIALKGSNQEVKDIIYENMSTRVRDTIKEDIEFLRGIRVRDVDEAQQRVVDIVRKLEESGEITIQRGGLEDEFI
ncbi:MAG: flagellar motor switch protein FliG [Oscillospiraceae bacterium]|jgi:flagellar motor switch protein FliG|nr:flagellar motor switch protein FliG [Oscillospiraceae bacterium]